MALVLFICYGIGLALTLLGALFWAGAMLAQYLEARRLRSGVARTLEPGGPTLAAH